jgi:hypothetical protein
VKLIFGLFPAIFCQILQFSAPNFFQTWTFFGTSFVLLGRKFGHLGIGLGCDTDNKYTTQKHKFKIMKNQGKIYGVPWISKSRINPGSKWVKDLGLLGKPLVFPLHKVFTNSMHFCAHNTLYPKGAVG